MASRKNNLTVARRSLSMWVTAAHSFPLTAGQIRSTPIMSQDGKVLGTFCMYYREVRHPTPDDIQLIDYASRIAGLAIERERSQAALTLALEQIRKSEAQLKQIVDIIPQGVAVLDPDGKALYVNQWLLDYSGLSREKILARDFRTEVFHPEDTDRVQHEH